MTRYLELFLAAVMAVMLAACGGSSLEAEEPETTNRAEDAPKGESVEPAASSGSDAESASEVSGDETVESSTDTEEADDGDDSSDSSDVSDVVEEEGSDDANLVEEDPEE